MVLVNKTLLWITKQQYGRSQDLPSVLVLMDNVFSELGSFKLSCYLPISGNSYTIIITWKTFRSCQESSANWHFFTLLDVCFRRDQEKAVSTVAAWMSCFINKLICIHFIPFWMNIIKKKLYEPATVKLEHFRNIFMISFWERLLSIPIRKRLLFLDITMTQYFTKQVYRKLFTFSLFDQVKVKLFN